MNNAVTSLMGIFGYDNAEIGPAMCKNARCSYAFIVISADDLQFFLEVARTGRLVAAAKALNVDHTTVGRRVTQLERDTGARMFDRAAGGWTLTEAGKRLLVHAEAVESSLLAASEELGTRAGRLSGTLRIAAPDGFGAFVVAPGISDLRAKYPELSVEIVTATRLNLLATKEFDVGVALEEPATRGVESTKLAIYPLALYANERYLEQSGDISSLDDLHGRALIGYVDSLLDIPALRFLESSLPGTKPAVQTNNITGQWMAAVAGLGVAVLPMYIAEPDRRLLRVLPSVTIHRTYWMAIPRDLQRLARTKAAQAALQRVVHLHPHLETPPAQLS